MSLPVESENVGLESACKSKLKAQSPCMISTDMEHKLRVLGNLSPENIGKAVDRMGATNLEKRQYRVAFGM